MIQGKNFHNFFKYFNYSIEIKNSKKVYDQNLVKLYIFHLLKTRKSNGNFRTRNDAFINFLCQCALKKNKKEKHMMKEGANLENCY